AVAIGAGRTDEGIVAAERRLEDVAASVELAHLAVARDVRVDARRRVERRQAGARRADALDQRPLRDELERDAPGANPGVHRRPLLWVEGVARDQLAHLAGLGEHLRGGRTDARGVGDQREGARSVLAQRLQQRRRPALHDAEASDEKRRAVGDVGHRLASAGDDLIHDWPAAWSAWDRL